jgi:dimethylhistidine N-methyltransferase
MRNTAAVQLIDLEPTQSNLAVDAIAGLKQQTKTLPCKLFYDKRGSELFDRICRLPEYYPTRTEIGIMNEYRDEIVAAIGSDVQLIELGSGSSSKTEILLDALDDLAAYVPVDISREHLFESAERIHHDYPDLEVQAICADYNEPFTVPEAPRPVSRRVAFFPGSTIGNFHQAEARSFLSRVADMVGEGGGLIIGVDLKKEEDELVAAYDDAEGVTAEFNLNVLHHLNREANADFEVDQFEHRSVWNEAYGRVEMHLVSRIDQSVEIDAQRFDFASGETVRTECAYKYSLGQFSEVAERFQVEQVWLDPDRRFSVQYLVVTDGGASVGADPGPRAQ